MIKPFKIFKHSMMDTYDFVGEIESGGMTTIYMGDDIGLTDTSLTTLELADYMAPFWKEVSDIFCLETESKPPYCILTVFGQYFLIEEDYQPTTPFSTWVYEEGEMVSNIFCLPEESC